MIQKRHTILVRLVLTVIISLFLIPIVTVQAAVTPISRSRWPRSQVTYVIQAPSYQRNVYLAAIRAWNATGQVKFVQGSNAHHQITLTTSTATTGKYRRLSGITFQTGYRNGYYTQSRDLLLTRNLSTYHYSYSNQIHVAEHELGHSIGLQHSSDKHSVMYNNNRYNGISGADTAAVRLRYRLAVGKL